MKLLAVIPFILFTFFNICSNDMVNYGVTAHRGNSGEFPENTIPAFKSAMALNVDWVELDVYKTKDGKLVVSHDKTTARTGNKALEIKNATYEELKTVDVASAFRKQQLKSFAECPPQKMPLLEDALKLFLNQDKIRVSIQPKVDCVKEAIDMVNNLGISHLVGFNDGNLGYMTEVKKLSPGIRVFWDRPADSDIEKDINIAKERGFEALVIRHDGITAEKIKKIKAAGLEAGAWTVNDVKVMEALLSIGVDRIYTDYPQHLIALKQR